MLRPATPLTVLLFIAFILLLVSVISTPVVKGIPLATFEGVDFGVFGYCKGSQCSGIRIGYTTHGLFGDPSNDGDFNLPSSARHSLSSLLVIHPVAAFLTLVCVGLAGAAHLHSPSHSARYLLGLLILLVPTLLVTLLAFLVDILLFVPHLQWGGWIVLAATILITASMVVTCAMRRTLVSRKARKKRIAENGEMSGENYYNRQESMKADSLPPLSADPNPPMVNGAPGANSLPSFATFDPIHKETSVGDEDRIPLNSRDPSTVRGPNSSVRDDGSERYGVPSARGYSGPRDEFGRPLPPSAAFGPPPGVRRDPSDPRLRNQYSNGSMGSQGRGPPGYGPGRGRGGYPPRGRGSYGPRGPPLGGFNGRGPPGGPMAAGMAGGMAAGAMMRGGGRGRGRGPPPGYPPQGQGDNREMAGAYGPPGSFRQRPPPPSQSYGSSQGPYGYDGRDAPPGAPGQPMAPPMPNMPPNIPPAAEMEGGGQMPGYGPGNRFRESDDDVQGMVGLQQNRLDGPARQNSADSPVNAYGSQDSYVPVRAGWGQHGPPVDTNQPTAPMHVSPVELPTAASVHSSHSPQQHRRVSSGDNYYEDVDPRFVESDPSSLPIPSSNALPAALTPGGGAPHGTGAYLRPSGSYDDIQEGARSPAASEVSHFTSVSQRGVNPNWRPPPGSMPVSRKPLQRDRDVLLGSNPDFEIPGAARGRGLAGRGGRMPGQIPALGGEGRYPMGDI